MVRPAGSQVFRVSDAKALGARGSGFEGVRVSGPSFYQINPKPLTLNPYPKTINPKPLTLNPKPLTLNP